MLQKKANFIRILFRFTILTFFILINVFFSFFRLQVWKDIKSQALNKGKRYEQLKFQVIFHIVQGFAMSLGSMAFKIEGCMADLNSYLPPSFFPS